MFASSVLAFPRSLDHFGFPEQLCAMYVALYDKHQSKIGKIIACARCIWVLCSPHHSFSVDMHALGQHGKTWINPSLTCLTLFWSFVSSSICLSCCGTFTRICTLSLKLSLRRGWFQWSVLSNYESFLTNHSTVAVAASDMLFALVCILRQGCCHSVLVSLILK